MKKNIEKIENFIEPKIRKIDDCLINDLPI